MFSMDVIDTVVYYPVIMTRRKMTDQDYLTLAHHIFGASAMVLFILDLYTVAKAGNPASPLSVSLDWDTLHQTGNASIFSGLLYAFCTAKFSNQFVYIAEVSSVPLSIRGIFKDRALRKDNPQPTNATLKLVVDIWFMISFFAC